MTTDRPNIIAPPPILFAICVIAAAIVDHYRPLPIMNGQRDVRFATASLLSALAVTIAATARREMIAHKEHPNPYKPTNTIVESGPYRFSRNPIYIAFFIVAIAVGFFANSWWIVASIIPIFFLLHFGVILREEQYLSSKFGETYEGYRRRVRRWI